MADKNPFEIFKDLADTDKGDEFDIFNKTQEAQGQSYPDEVEAQDWFRTDLFEQLKTEQLVGNTEVYRIPLTDSNYADTYAVSSAMDYWTTIFGGNLAPVMQAALSPDGRQYRLLQRLIANIAKMDMTPIPPRGPGAGDRLDPVDNSTVLLTALQDPTYIENLPGQQRNEVIEIAREAQKSLVQQGKGIDQSWVFRTIAGQTRSGDYDVFLNEDEKNALDQLVAQFGGSGPAQRQQAVGKGGAPTPQQDYEDMLGVASLEGVGGQYPKLVLDDAWARAHPIKAAAVMDSLRSRYPGIQFQVGENGIIGEALDMWGSATDVVSIPFGWLGGKIARRIDEWQESRQITPQQREEAKEWKKELETRIEKGQIPVDKMEETLRLIRYAEDLSTEDYSYTWSEAVDNGINPRAAGTALADNLFQAVGKEPGDPGMAGLYAATNLFQGLVFDPANYIFPFASGARAGLRGVAAAGEAAGVVDTTVKTFAQADDIAKVVQNGRHAIFQADDDLIGILRTDGFKPQKVVMNRNGQKIESLLVPNVTPEQAIHYANQFGQTDVITREGLINVAERSVHPIKKVNVGAGQGFDNTLQWGTKRGWQYEFTTRSTKLRPNRIGENWLRSKAFQMFAPNPEDWIASPYMHAAAERIIAYGKAVDNVDRFTAWLTRTYKMDPVQARVFAHAESPEAVLRLFHLSVTGGMETSINAARNATRISELSKKLNEGDLLEQRIEKLKTIDQNELVSADELNELHADLTGGGQREGMFAVQGYAEDITGSLAKRVKVAAPGRVEDITEGLSSYEKFLFRTHLQKLRIAKDNIINAPELLQRGRAFAAGGRFYTDMRVDLLRDRSLLDEGRAAQYRVRDAQGGTPVRSKADLERTKQWLRQTGGKNPEGDHLMVEVLPNGKITILDGTHRAMLAEELGMETVPVQFNTAGLEVADRTYLWLQEHMPEALEVATPLPDDLVPLTRESKLLRDAENQMEVLRATRDADVTELAYLRSIQNGRIWQVPIRKFPPRSIVRRTLTKGLDNTMVGRGLGAMADFAEKGLPLHLAYNARIGTAFLLGGKEFAESERSARNLLHWYTQFFRSHGAGTSLDLGRFGKGAVSDADGNIIRLVDQDQIIVDNLRNMAKMFGMPNARIDDLVGGIINAKGVHGRFDAYTRYWETIADESPGLGALERTQVAKWSGTELLSRNPGFISKNLDNGIMDAKPTHWSMKTAPDGSVYEVGRPVFSSDALHTVHLPDIEQVLNWISFNRRLLNTMKGGNKAQRFLAGGANVVHEGWHIANQSIKTLLLAFRMPLALPLRIVSEEHLRMAAFDNATLVNHPAEWWRMFKGKGEYDMFEVGQTELLGLLHEQFLSDYRIAKVGRRQVVFGFDDDWYKAMSIRLQQIAKSPEVRKFYIDDLSDPQRVLSRMEGNEGRAAGVDDMLEMWDEAIDPDTVGAMKSRLEATTRALDEVSQLIGQGTAAERIRDALRSGRYADESGKAFDLGSAEFAEELKRIVDDGQWAPDAKVLAIRENEYMYAGVNERLSGLRSMRDGVFKLFYTGIDKAVARQPLWRGLARREYNRLISLGWKPERAKKAAEALAYRQTADMLYRIGETTSGHHFARNISPFLPAFQELTTTWAYRIPKEMGAGFLAPGWARLARKVDVYMDFFKQSGMVKTRTTTNPETGEVEEEYYTEIPVLSHMFSKMFGANIQATASLESFTGILPDPQKKEKALIPGLSSPTSYLLGEFANQTDIADELVDALLPFGREATIGPTAVNRIFAAFGWVPFWESGTSDYQHHLINSSIDDGIQIAFTKYGKDMPKLKDYDDEDAYVKAHQAWVEKIVQEGEKWSTVRYLTRGIGSAILPFSVNYQPERAREMQTIWALINSPAESERTLASPLINAFKETYPDAVWFANGKSINLAPDRDFSVSDPFFEQISMGLRDEMTPEEYVRYSVGMNSYYVYLNRRNQALREAGDTPFEILTNGFDKSMNIAKIDAEWNQYLALTDEEDPVGGGRSFHALFDLYQRARDEAASREGHGFDVTVDDQYLLDVKKGMQALSGLFTENGIRDGEYREILGTLSEAGSGINYPEPTTAQGQAIAHFFEANREYHEKVGAIYDVINITDRAERAPLYEQLRQLANAQEPTVYNGFKLPTPEQASWGNLSQQEQDVRLVEWGKLEPEWLTNFQAKKLGIKGSPEKLDELFTFMNASDVQFRHQSQNLHPSSNDYQDMKAFYAGNAAQKAKELGLSHIIALKELAPVFRIDYLIGKDFKNESWNQAVKMAEDVWSRLSSRDIAVAGSTPEAVYYQKWLTTRVEEMRNADPGFRKLLDRVKEAFIPTGQEDMGQMDFYWKLWFDGFMDGAPPYLVYGGDK